MSMTQSDIEALMNGSSIRRPEDYVSPALKDLLPFVSVFGWSESDVDAIAIASATAALNTIAHDRDVMVRRLAKLDSDKAKIEATLAAARESNPELFV